MPPFPLRCRISSEKWGQRIRCFTRNSQGLERPAKAGHQTAQVRDTQRDGRDEGDKEQCHDHGGEQRHNVLGNAFDLDLADTTAHEQAGTDRRGDRADAQVHDEHDAELHIAHADAAGDGQEDGGEDQNRRGQIQEHTHDQQEHVHDQQDDVAVAGNAHQRIADSGRDAGVAHDVGHDGGSGDQEQDGSAALHGVCQQIVETLEGHLLIQDGQQAAVQAKHHTGLRSGEEACQNAAHDNDDGQQRGHCINDDLDGGVGVLDVGGLIALLDGDEHSQTSHAQTHQDAGQVAAHEQSSHRNAAGGDGVKDQRAGRGDLTCCAASLQAASGLQ